MDTTTCPIVKREFGYTVFATPAGNRIVFDDAERQLLEAREQDARTVKPTESQLKAQAIDAYWRTAAGQWWQSKNPGYRATQFLNLHGLADAKADRATCDAALQRLPLDQLTELNHRVAATPFHELRRLLTDGTKLTLKSEVNMNHYPEQTRIYREGESGSTLNQSLLKVQTETRKLDTNQIDRVFDALGEAEILFSREMTACTPQTYRTAKGVERERVMVTMTFILESRHERKEIQWIGMANGVSQRAIEKAAASAERSFLIQQFGLQAAPAPPKAKPGPGGKSTTDDQPAAAPAEATGEPGEAEARAEAEFDSKVLSFSQQLDAEIIAASREIERVRGGEVLKLEMVQKWPLSVKRQTVQNLANERTQIADSLKANYATTVQQLSRRKGDEPLGTKEITDQLKDLSLSELSSKYRHARTQLETEKQKAS